MTAEWKVFYGDGTTFSSEEGGPEVAPARNVQVIVQSCRWHKTEIVTQGDYYVWEDGWRATDQFGMYDYLIEPGWKVILQGRMLKQSEYNEIVRHANIEKTGWLAREHKTT